MFRVAELQKLVDMKAMQLEDMEVIVRECVSGSECGCYFGSHSHRNAHLKTLVEESESRLSLLREVEAK